MGGHSGGGLFRGTLGDTTPNASSTCSASSESAKLLVAEAQEKGLNIDPGKVVAIAKKPDGKIVWLETGHSGNGGSGLAHILEEHGSQFASKGISSSDLPEYLIQAVSSGKIVGMQGSRPVYELSYNGIQQRVAITVSNNGYIVGANPKSLPKEEN